MKKLVGSVVFCCFLTVCVYCADLVSDKTKIQNGLIRLHVVANSDSEEDQKIKLYVRDAVLESLQHDLAQIGDVESAKQYLLDNLPTIERLANAALQRSGFAGEAVVSLKKEAFDTRYYDTFTLPAGVYESLRIVIGEGSGKNWWCVAFPSLCLPATVAEFEDTAAAAGFSEEMTGTLSGQKTYKLRFFLMDAVGKLENIFFEG